MRFASPSSKNMPWVYGFKMRWPSVTCRLGNTGDVADDRYSSRSVICQSQHETRRLAARAAEPADHHRRTIWHVGNGFFKRIDNDGKHQTGIVRLL